MATGARALHVANPGPVCVLKTKRAAKSVSLPTCRPTGLLDTASVPLRSKLRLSRMSVNGQMCFLCPVACAGPDSCALEGVEIVFDARPCARYGVIDRARSADASASVPLKDALRRNPRGLLERRGLPPCSNRGANSSKRGSVGGRSR